MLWKSSEDVNNGNQQKPISVETHKMTTVSQQQFIYICTYAYRKEKEEEINEIFLSQKRDHWRDPGMGSFLGSFLTVSL